MKRGVCPKCGSNDVRSGANVGDILRIEGSMLLGVFAGRDNYVCAKCGYVESYIANSRDLQKIIDRWPRVEQKEPGQREE